MGNLKFCLLAALLCLGVFSQNQIFYSTPDNVKVSEYGPNPPPGIRAPPSQPLIPGVEPNSRTPSIDTAAFMRANTVGGQAQWVLNNNNNNQKRSMTGPGSWWQFDTTFITDCPQYGATITITAFPYQYVVIVLNGVVIGQGWGPTITASTRNCTVCGQNKNCSCLKCGCNNNLTVWVWVPCGCPVGACYDVRQDTTGCYDCDKESLAFYNRKTCQCECSGVCNSCGNPAQQWFGYPTCGCMCTRQIPPCPKNMWPSKQSCRCECNAICCPSGTVQDPNSCQCVSTGGGTSGCWPNCNPSPGGIVPLPCNTLCPFGTVQDANCNCVGRSTGNPPGGLSGTPPPSPGSPGCPPGLTIDPITGGCRK